MRSCFLVFCLCITSVSLYADDNFFENKMQKVGKSIDKAAIQVKDKVETVAQKAQDQTAEKSKTIGSRVSSAFEEIGQGISRAWKKLVGE